MTPAELFKLFFSQDFRWADMVDAERRKGNPNWEVGKRFLNGAWSKWFAAINEELERPGPDFVNRWLTIAHEQIFPAATRAGFPAQSFIIPDITIHETVGASMASFLDVLESANPLVTTLNPGLGMALSTALKANEVIAQAKNGDPVAKGKLAAVKAKADSGDPEAQAAIAEMSSISRAQDDKAASFLRRTVRDHRRRGRGWLNIVGHDPYTFVGATNTNATSPPKGLTLAQFKNWFKANDRTTYDRNNRDGSRIWNAWYQTYQKYYQNRSSTVATSTRPPVRNSPRPPAQGGRPRSSTPVRPGQGLTNNPANIPPGTMSSDGRYVWNGRNWVRPQAPSATAAAEAAQAAQNPYAYPPQYPQQYPGYYDPYAQYPQFPQSPYPYDPYAQQYQDMLAQQQALAYSQYAQDPYGVVSNPNNMVWDEATQSFYSNQVNQRYDAATDSFVPCIAYNPYNEYMVSGKGIPNTGFFGRLYNKGLRGR